MTCYNNWANNSETIDDKYDTFENIIFPNISNILDDKLNKIEIKKSIDDYCIDDYLNMNFHDFCNNCYLHEPKCVCI